MTNVLCMCKYLGVKVDPSYRRSYMTIDKMITGYVKDFVCMYGTNDSMSID